MSPVFFAVAEVNIAHWVLVTSSKSEVFIYQSTRRISMATVVPGGAVILDIGIEATVNVQSSTARDAEVIVRVWGKRSVEVIGTEAQSGRRLMERLRFEVGI